MIEPILKMPRALTSTRLPPPPKRRVAQYRNGCSGFSKMPDGDFLPYNVAEVTP